MEPSEEQWLKFKSYLNTQKSQLKADALQDTAAEEEFQDFLVNAKEGRCYVCKKSLKTFSASSPCPHWLLRPKGVKKEHIREVLSKDGYYRTAAFLRWFANFGAHSRNINDLAEEGDANAIFHWSCSYEHRKWTFKCAKGDYKGHEGTKHEYPHYHFEMRLKGRIFIKFNDFHVPFTEEDMFWSKVNSDDSIPVKQGFGYHGSGMQDAMNVEPTDLIANLQKGQVGEEDKAVYQLDSFFFSEEGISGDLVADAIDASKKSGKTIAYHLGEMELDPNVIVSPADTIIDKSDRTKTRTKKS